MVKKIISLILLAMLVCGQAFASDIFEKTPKPGSEITKEVWETFMKPNIEKKTEWVFEVERKTISWLTGRVLTSTSGQITLVGRPGEKTDFKEIPDAGTSMDGMLLEAEMLLLGTRFITLTSSNVPLDLENYKYSGIEIITVPAGTFKTIKIYSTKVKQGDKLYEWYAPGIGMVKRVYEISSKSHITVNTSELLLHRN